MAQDPRTEKVTARVIFVGVMFGCINKDDRYEVGMITCPLHSPKIWVTKMSGEKVTVPWPAGHDLIFKVVNPRDERISKHLPNPDPLEVSFNSVVDLEGPDLHSGGVKVNVPALNGRRIGVTDGMLYAHELTQELNLMTWKEEGDQNTFNKPFGRIAKVLGLNIVCRDEAGSGIQLLDATTGETLYPMPALDGESYTIEVNNDCNRPFDAEDVRPAATRKNPNQISPDAVPASDPPAGSDFRFSYQVITPVNPLDPKFDFELIGEPDPNPDVCNVGRGGKTTSIGLDWSKI